MSQQPPNELYDQAALRAMLGTCDYALVPDADAHGPQAEPARQAALQAVLTDSEPISFVAPLPDLGVIRVSGDEREAFLQGQLTNDIEKLPVGQAHWTGLCSPKGRLIASFLAIKTGRDILLVISRELAGAIARRLSMYVLRAKVKVLDVSSAVLPVGLVGPGLSAALDSAGLSAPPLMHGANRGAGDADDQQLLVVTLPAVSVSADGNVTQWPRVLLAAGAGRLESLWPGLAGDLLAAPSHWWRATEVATGIARITPPVQDTFVPQMINFELVGGVDFDKGCYTGQEVVARSQYLGKMKRRMFLAVTNGEAGSDTPVAPGVEVHDDHGKAVGTVVASAPGLAVGIAGHRIVLFEARVDGIDDTGHASVLGVRLRTLPLPYEIPEPTPFVRPH